MDQGRHSPSPASRRGCVSAETPALKESDFAPMNLASPSLLPPDIHQIGDFDATLTLSTLWDLEFAKISETNWLQAAILDMWDMQYFEHKHALDHQVDDELEALEYAVQQAENTYTTTKTDILSAQSKFREVKRDGARELRELKAQYDLDRAKVQDKMDEAEQQLADLNQKAVTDSSEIKRAQDRYAKGMQAKTEHRVGVYKSIANKHVSIKMANTPKAHRPCGARFHGQITEIRGLIKNDQGVPVRGRADILEFTKHQAKDYLTKLDNFGYSTNLDYLEHVAHPQILNKQTWDRLYGDGRSIYTGVALRGWRGPKELQHRLASYLHFPFSPEDRATLEAGEWLAVTVEGNVDSPPHQRRRV